MSKPNYELKAKLLQNGKVKQVKTFRDKVLRNWDIYDPLGKMEEEFLFMTENHFSSGEYTECNRVIKSTYSRNSRLYKRIGYMLSLGKCYFLTLTFNPECLDNTNKETRKKYVLRWLKSNTEHYVANIDYGGKNGREHYHAVVYPGAIYMNYEEWHKNGAILGEIVKKPSKSNIPLAKYVSKLTNHAIKETTRRNAMIYSRLPV